jgi:hypothetical protein
MSTVDSNIEFFNQHVKVKRDGLKARKESSDVMTIKLCKAYIFVTDSDVARYMRDKKYYYDVGEDFTVEQLLTMSLIKFHILKDYGKWNSLSPEKEQIVAIISEVTYIKGYKLKLSNNVKPTKGKNYGDTNKKSGKGKKPRKKASDEGKWAWKKVPPKEGLGQSKYRILIKATIGVNIIRHGLFISQHPAQFELPVKKQKQSRLLLQYWKGLNLMSETLSLCPVLLLIGT